MGDPYREVVLWPSAENYAEFAALCDDEVADDHESFVEQAEQRIAQLRARGIIGADVRIERIGFDPAAMARWCRANGGKVDSQARAQYAAWLAARE